MPVALIVIGAILALILLLLLLRVRLVIAYRSSFTAELRVLFLRFTLYPRKKRIKPKKYSPRKAARAERKAAKKAAKAAAKKQKKQKKKSAADKKAPAAKAPLRERIRLIRALCAALIRRTHKHLRLHTARLHVRVGTGDAAKTAVLYGAVSQSVSHLLFALDKVTRLRAAEPEVSVVADFTAERSVADIKLVFSIRVYGVLATALAVGLAYVKKKLFKQRKRPVKGAKKK